MTQPLVVDRRSRVIGVDVARGLALIGMMATHVFDTLDDNDAPTVAHVVAGGRAATTFVLVAGVSLAFLSGGRRRPHGRDLLGVRAGLAVRAGLVGAIGLALGYLGEANGIDGILPFYAALFLLAIPLLGAAPLVLVGVAAAAAALGPVLLVATADAGLPYAGSGAEPTFHTLVQDPGGLLALLFLTGEYPVVTYLAYLCVGLAIGRLDLRSPRLAWLLLGCGVALAVLAQAVSAVLLHPLGGLARLVEQDGLDTDPTAVAALLWEAEQSASWEYLALATPHSHTPFDTLHTLGSAAAVLGAALLLTRIRSVGRVLAPLAAAGAMSLTLYSGHLVLLATGVLQERPALLFAVMVAGAIGLAAGWRAFFRQGPLEALVTKSATAVRRGVARLAPPPQPGSVGRHRATPDRPRTGPLLPAVLGGGAQVLAPVAGAGLLALTFWAGAQLAPAEDATVTPAPVPAVATSAEDELPAAAPPDTTARYCELSDQVDAVEEANPDNPEVVVAQAEAQLDELPQVAPPPIRDAVTVIVEDYRAEAGVAGAVAPDEAGLASADAAVVAFEDQNC